MKKKDDKRKGKDSQLRPITDAPTANQHVRNPRQEAFLDAYLEVSSPTFGNAYASAITVGYSDVYAREIASPSTGNEWITDNPRIRRLQDTHISLMVDDIATDKSHRTADRLKALELSAKLKGMLVERKHVVSEVIEISLGSYDVPMPTVITPSASHKPDVMQGNGLPTPPSPGPA